jgi:hypothetical protein
MRLRGERELRLDNGVWIGVGLKTFADTVSSPAVFLEN